VNAVLNRPYGVRPQYGYNGPGPIVRRVLELCDPRRELSSESQFIDFWMRARGAIEAFMTAYNHNTPRTFDPTEGPQ
jgi:hypothetical protein